jgi:hypothetical protein
MAKFKPYKLNYRGKRADDKRAQNDPLAKHLWPRLNDDAVLFGKRVQKLTEGPHAGCHVVFGSDPDSLPPVFVWEGAPRSAAYISFNIMLGDIDEHLYVIPRCGTKGCINVNHLILRDYAGMRSFYAKRQNARQLKERQMGLVQVPNKKAQEQRQRKDDPLVKRPWCRLNDDAVLFGKRIQKITEGKHSGCHIILGCDPSEPPPTFKWEGAYRNAAYINFNIVLGSIDDHLFVIPKCGTRGCVNVNHLILRDESGRHKFYAEQHRQSTKDARVEHPLAWQRQEGEKE